MIQRGGEIVMRMLADVKQATIGPLIRRTIRPGATGYVVDAADGPAGRPTDQPERAS